MPEYTSRIVLRHRQDRRVEISIYSTDMRKEMRLGKNGLVVEPCRVDGEVCGIKEALEKKGHQVMVVDL